MNNKNYFLFLINTMLVVSSFSQNYVKDATFNIGDGFDVTPDYYIELPDNKLLVAGGFDYLNNTEAKRLVRLMPDGGIDPEFSADPSLHNKFVNRLKALPDGRIAVAFKLSSLPNAAGGLVLLYPDGNIDDSFSAVQASNPINDIEIQSDGKILICGNFYSINGATRNSVARFNSNGTVDTSFNAGNGSNIETNDLQLLPDGKIIVAGSFSSFNGNVSQKSITRLLPNGSVDPEFTPGSYYQNRIHKVAVQDDGKIIAVGDFIQTPSLDGSTNRIIRLMPNGEKDATFNIGSGFGGGTRYITLLDDGSSLVGGNMIHYNGTGTLANGLIVLQSDGTQNTAYNFGYGFYTGHANINVTKTDQLNSGKIMVLGTFHSYNGVNLFNTPKLTRLVDQNLAVTANEKDEFIFYPNPAITNLTVKAPEATDLLLFDCNGRKLTSFSLSSGENTLDISGFSKGIYFLQYQGENQTETRKLVVN